MQVQGLIASSGHMDWSFNVLPQRRMSCALPRTYEHGPAPGRVSGRWLAAKERTNAT